MKNFKKRLTYILFFCSILNCSPVFADDCLAGGGGIGLHDANISLDCAKKNQVIADRKMNDVYKNIIRKLKDDAEKEDFSHSQMIYAQRAWIAFRDAECDFRISISGGAHQWREVNQVECLTELTQDRLKMLNGYLDQIDSN